MARNRTRCLTPPWSTPVSGTKRRVLVINSVHVDLQRLTDPCQPGVFRQLSFVMRGILGVFERIFECLIGLGKYGCLFLRSFLQSRSATAARIVALESQLDVCLRRRGGKRFSRFSDSFRLLWVILSWLWEGWERVCHAMKPRTVVEWKDRV